MRVHTGFMSRHEDVLEVAGRTPWSRRRTVTVIVLLVVTVAGVAALDQRSREREADQVAACRERAAETVDAGFRGLTSMTTHVRPALGSPDRVRATLLATVSRSVSGVDQRLIEARSRCDEVSIWWFHSDLVRQRDTCIRGLEGQITWFRSIAENGSRAFRGGVGRRGTGCG